MFDQTFLYIVLLYGMAVYFDGHQASHLMYIKEKRGDLNPTLTFILSLYAISHLPWLVLIWVGYRTTWYYPLVVILFAQLVRLVLISIQDKLDLTKDAWAISLLGLVAIPVSLICIILIISNV